MRGGNEREDFAAFLLRMRSRGMDNMALFAAMEAAPRSGFLPSEWMAAAWSKRMVPIACGETIEGCDLQATVLNALELAPTHRVLEIGTGSGFTAAVMAKLAGRVLTLDRYKTLVSEAQQRFETLGITNIATRLANGEEGAPDGPFDRIVCWAAFEEMPRRFADQLTMGGVMIAPIGPGDGVQAMARLSKIGSRFERVDLFPVRLQPLAQHVAEAI